MNNTLLLLLTLLLSYHSAGNDLEIALDDSMTAFVTTWETTSPNQSLTIPTTGPGYNYDVDWGDGNITNNHNGNASHNYSSPGMYQISITGSFPRIFFLGATDKDRIISIDQWGTQVWLSMENAFNGCSNLEELATDAPNLTVATSMRNMFRACTNLNQNISNWNVSNITDMNSLFRDAYNFNQNINSWNVSNVMDMGYMFAYANHFDQPLDNWDVSNVTTMNNMFEETPFNQPIGIWDVSSVTSTAFMFSSNLVFNKDISGWDVSQVTDMSGMFSSYLGTFKNNFNRNLGAWNVSNVTSFYEMFYQSKFNKNLGNWDVTGATFVDYMFAYSDFDKDITAWDVSNITHFSGMFEGCINFNYDLSSWDVSNAIIMEVMFDGSGLTVEHYDLLLNNWSKLNLQQDVIFGVGLTEYCDGEDGRMKLINDFNWTINDGGPSAVVSIPNTFTNAMGNDLWNDDGNWSLGFVPNEIHAVTIPLGLTANILAGEVCKCFTLEVEQGAVLEVNLTAELTVSAPCNY